MSSARLTCPACGAVYEAGHRFCQRDGTALLAEAHPAPAAAPRAAASGPGAPGAAPPASAGWRGALARIPKETVAGLTIVGVVAALVAGVFVFRQVQVFRLQVSWHEAHGLKVGDSVFVKGADVGEVTSAEFKDGVFLATLQIDPDSAPLIRRESAFFVGYEKLATQKMCVAILVMDDKSPPVENGDVIEGEDNSVKFYSQMVRQHGFSAAQEIWNEMKAMLGSAADQGAETEE